MNNFVSLEWIAGGNCPVIRGNPFSSSTSFERDNINGLKMKEINLTQGKVALVDDEDYEYLNQWKWYACKDYKTYYAQRNGYVNGKRRNIFMHKVILNPPTGLEVDHIDRDGLNNVRSNLRLATRQQNSFNRRKFGKCKYIGVTVLKQGKCQYIVANIRMGNRRIYLGMFPTEEAAALAYNEAALKYRGEFAHLNVIESNN